MWATTCELRVCEGLFVLVSDPYIQVTKARQLRPRPHPLSLLKLLYQLLYSWYQQVVHTHSGGCALSLCLLHNIETFLLMSFFINNYVGV